MLHRSFGYAIKKTERWNISIRSDPEGQHVYGPSLATVENTVVEPNGTGGTTTKLLGSPRPRMSF